MQTTMRVWSVAAFAFVATCTMPTPTRSQGLVVLEGGDFCSVTGAGDCVTDGAGEHGNRESCRIAVQYNGNLTATEFDTEVRCGYIYPYIPPP